MYPLDLEKKVKAIKSLIQSSEYSDEVKNYEDWLYCSYGKYFSDHYPSKYTKKYWRYDAKELDIDWLGPRMPSVDIELVLEGAMSEAERNTYYVKEMRYPKKGAYYEFIKDLASGVNALCEEQVISVNLEEQYILIRSGNKIHYSYIINTSPLPDLVKIISKVPNKIMMYAQDLEATSVDLISIGMKSSIKFKSLWFYIYDEDIYASRCYSPSIKSTENAPIGHSSIQFEIYSVSDESKPSVDEMKNNCIYALKKMKICNEEDILFIEHHNEENANVIFKKGTSLNASSIVKWLKLHKVFSAGRFGEWKYLWSNQSFISGLNAAKSVIEEINENSNKEKERSNISSHKFMQYNHKSNLGVTITPPNLEANTYLIEYLSMARKKIKYVRNRLLMDALKRRV